jgi:hypothetical protein
VRRVLALVALSVVLGSALPAAAFRARARDFRCLLDGVRPTGKSFYLFHHDKKKLAEAVAIAASGTPGQEYPAGTIIQLFPFEAMAKRGGAYNPSGHGWEFFQLGTTPSLRTKILHRGGITLANAFGSCQGCHSTGDAPAFDLVCEGHGAVRIPLSPAQVTAIQLADPRCRKAH